MKKLFIALVSILVLGALLQSCAPARGKGCPTTNPRYFRP